MTDSVTPRAPDPPLVDPETGETPPLSPRALGAALKETFDYMMEVQHAPPEKRRAWLYGEWDEYEEDIAAHLVERLEPDDAA